MNKIAAVLILLVLVPLAHAYSVLTHEQIIDLAWKDSIRPVLLSRFPNTTEAELLRAHSYAYGGCAIQDAGYYPFGKAFFSDLTHYVRTGDFVSALIRDARNVDELAFALGALSHYVGDNFGHHDAVNPSTAIAFPNLAAKYGPIVTYDDSPHGHVRTEFAFDIDQLSKHRLAPSAYLRHVGLRVSARLLDQAFYETYGLHANKIIGKERAAISSYRWSVRGFLPAFAYAEVLLHRKSFPQDVSTPAFDAYAQRVSQADFSNGWEQYRKKPGIRTHVLAFLIVIVPKIGAASDLAIRGPNEQTEQMYFDSVNQTLARYEQLLDQARSASTNQHSASLQIENRDLDTGARVRPGGYPLTDQTYAKLLDRLSKTENPLPEQLKNDVLAYYADPDAPIVTRKNPGAWQKVQRELSQIKTMPVVAQIP
ncbi:zinc dependent phospholipase C family protein [Silvibacterium acidisoli]|uniref:zinc dependent phospholipase C family protein n=1 Tax=Acidobacteriaceae bacterium ZG23-2 TaxID=2883246 RepID=UPI00406CF4C5